MAAIDSKILKKQFLVLYFCQSLQHDCDRIHQTEKRFHQHSLLLLQSLWRSKVFAHFFWKSWRFYVCWYTEIFERCQNAIKNSIFAWTKLSIFKRYHFNWSNWGRNSIFVKNMHSFDQKSRSIVYGPLIPVKCNGHGHLYDDSSAPSLHGKNREIGAKEVNIKVSMPFRPFPGVSKTGVSTNQKLIFCDLDRCHIFSWPDHMTKNLRFEI